ncbi:sel1 repeat family protein [Comamonas thiooxydans]|uniref:sel1 repeat family protein n=1 Tax=Comamonas thiooxydans TaxID=363952 RepID=UPI002447D55D|nr:sel1 repeat family protein [Comamonas thiooxydans]MDH1253713.1 sel1 repeat family protein [Comamonas thiooxydans]
MRLEFRSIATPARHAVHALFIAATLSGALVQAAPLPFDMATTPEQRFQLALEAQTAGDYVPMLALLRQAARDGEAQAQETLAWVLLAGPNLYGKAVKADRCEAAHWLRQAVAKGSQTARSQLNFLNRLRNAPNGKIACASEWKG